METSGKIISQNEGDIEMGQRKEQGVIKQLGHTKLQYMAPSLYLCPIDPRRACAARVIIIIIDKAQKKRKR